MVTRAIHVELVPGLDTSTFRNALRRFFALFGVCKHLRSDNASTFCCAVRQMGNDYEKTLEILKLEAQRANCDWIFNPPTASHFGGLWERAIRKVRSILDAVILVNGNRAISRDEMDTLFKEACAIVNNTPMYQSSHHPDEPLPITAASLMTMKDTPNPPPLDIFTEADLNAYGKLRWRRIQHLADEFWHRWRNNVLSELMSRQKWTKQYPNLIAGDLVLMRAKNLKRNDWPTGVIQDVKLSDDGIVRSCTVRTNKGLYVRPVCELVKLSPERVGVSRQKDSAEK